MLRDSLSLKHLAQPNSRVDIGKPPLLLLLHGIGSNEQELFELAPEFDARFYVLSLQAPYQIAPDQYAWYQMNFTPHGLSITPDQAEASRKKLIHFIDEAVDHYEADPAKVYLLGFSQGAIMSLSLLLTAPEGLAGVVAIAGRLLPGLFKSDSPLGNHLASTEALKGRALFLGHGLQDETIPIAYGRQAENLLSRAPIQMSYREYDMGHSISPRCLNEAKIWLETQLAGY